MINIKKYLKYILFNKRKIKQISQIYDIVCIDNLNINQNLQNEKIFTNLKKSFGNQILIKNYASLRIR